MKNWKELLFFCAFMLVFAIVFQSIPPVVGLLIESLGITHAQAGALTISIVAPQSLSQRFKREDMGKVMGILIQ